jgi:C-terminal processing protease CtpA/Prc
MTRFPKRVSFSLLIAVLFLCAFPVAAQKKMDRIERETMNLMLKNIKNKLKKNYYDENYRGIDIEARFARAEARLTEVSTTGEALAAIAQVLMDFDDSHLYFIPPSTNLDVEYGWRHQMYGDKLLVTTVKPKSDAEAKGLKAGDEIVAIEGFRPTRKELWKANYYYNVLSKRASLRLNVLSPGTTEPRELIIESKIRKLPKVYTEQSLFQLFDSGGRSTTETNYFVSVGNSMIWKMPTFSVAPATIDTLVGKLGDAQNVILDLRGNGGGAVVALERLAAWMFDKDLTIAELKGRKKFEPIASKTRGKGAFKGKLVVLIDSESGSAAEMFARSVQLEGRGQVVGDISSGSVLQAIQDTEYLGAGDEIAWGLSVTNADVLMSDGKSLENVGVQPDVLVVTSPADIANGRDPVLVEALKLMGSSISPEEAGRIFRLKWGTTVQGRDFIEIDRK